MKVDYTKFLNINFDCVYKNIFSSAFKDKQQIAHKLKIRLNTNEGHVSFFPPR